MTKHETIDAETGEILEATAVVVAPEAPAPAIIAQGGTSIDRILERAVSEGRLDVISQLLDTKERLEDRAREDEDRRATRQFFADLAAAQSAIPVVLRNRTNSFNNTKFADLAAIEDTAMPVIRAHGFSVSAKSVPGAEAGNQRVVFRVAHRLGHVDQFEDDFPLDNQGTGGKASKTNIQAKGSTVTYARRYMLCAYFNIAIADSDGAPQRQQAAAQVAAPTELTGSQVKALRTLIAAAGADEKRFLSSAKATSLEDIRPADFQRLEGLLKRKLAEKQATQAAASAEEKPAA